MITCDTKDLLSDIDKFVLESERKLKGMVRDFSEAVIEKAIEETPIGDSIRYAAWYDLRVKKPTWQSYGLKPIEGFAQGSWRISLDNTLKVQEIYTTKSGEIALDIARNEVGDYKLGDKVLISNQGPYIQDLERNYSIQTEGIGIMQPTLTEVTSLYQHQLSEYYNRS